MHEVRRYLLVVANRRRKDDVFLDAAVDIPPEGQVEEGDQHQNHQDIPRPLVGNDTPCCIGDPCEGPYGGPS